MLEEEREHADLVHSTEVGWRPRRTNVIRVQESVEINRPVEEVFSYTTNPENFHHCAATVMEIRHEDAPGGEGPLCRKGARFTLVQ